MGRHNKAFRREYEKRRRQKQKQKKKLSKQAEMQRTEAVKILKSRIHTHVLALTLRLNTSPKWIMKLRITALVHLQTSPALIHHSMFQTTTLLLTLQDQVRPFRGKELMQQILFL